MCQTVRYQFEARQMVHLMTQQKKSIGASVVFLQNNKQRFGRRISKNLMRSKRRVWSGVWPSEFELSCVFSIISCCVLMAWSVGCSSIQIIGYRFAISDACCL